MTVGDLKNRREHSRKDRLQMYIVLELSWEKIKEISGNFVLRAPTEITSDNRENVTAVLLTSGFPDIVYNSRDANGLTRFWPSSLYFFVFNPALGE